MMTMVERVARRLFAVDYPDAGEVEETLWVRREAFYTASARAAIEEMRVPTKAMINSTWEIIAGSNHDADDVWETMIAAALTESL